MEAEAETSMVMDSEAEKEAEKEVEKEVEVEADTDAEADSETRMIANNSVEIITNCAETGAETATGMADGSG